MFHLVIFVMFHFVILSAAKLSRFAGVSAAGARRRNPERSEGSAFLS
jgi:hypothetical protein